MDQNNQKKKTFSHTINIFAFFIVGVLLGTMLATVGVQFFYNNVGVLFRGILFVAIVLILIFGVIIWEKERIARKLFGKFAATMEDLEKEITAVKKSFVNGNREDRLDAGGKLLKGLFARYAWITSRQWLFSVITSLFVGFAGIYGSILFVKQNDLIAQQNQYFQEQNKALIEQAKEQMRFQQETKEVELISNLYEEKPTGGAKANPRFRLEVVKSLLKIARPSDSNQFSLSGALLHNMTFENMDFRNVNLAGADLSQSTFKNVNLSGCNLESALLHGAKFEGENTKLYQANLSYTKMSNAQFMDVDMRKVQLKFATMEDITFSNTKMDSVVFESGAWSNVFFGTVDAKAVLFKDLNLAGKNVKFDFTTLADTEIENSDAAESIILDEFSELNVKPKPAPNPETD